MATDRLSQPGPVKRAFTRSFHERLLAGLSWKGVALIAVACVLNALRRSSDSLAKGAIGDWVFGVAQGTGTGLIVAFFVTLAVVATYNLAPSSPRWRYPALAIAVLISSLVGTMVLLGVETLGTFDTREYGGMTWFLIGTWPRYALLGGLFTAVFVHLRTAEDSEAATRQAELDRALFAQQMDEARLQMLQAQIEPHFLFNTLATVRRLYQTEPRAGAEMLENLMSYLAVALPQMRASDSTLGREAALAEAYLSIQKIRMGRRLTFTMDIPDALREAALPPMMLLTLAENAIKHGLSPLPDGGVIRVSARAEHDRLDVRVTDSGQGFTKTSGGGTGLANIRARLAALYGNDAQLRLAANHPRGVTAIIALPCALAARIAKAA